jgi:hypothetical protein
MPQGPAADDHFISLAFDDRAAYDAAEVTDDDLHRFLSRVPV